MGLSINTTGLEITVDPETGSILFYRKKFSGIPEQVVHGDGFTIELSGNEVVLIDIYNTDLLLSKLADGAIAVKAS